MPYTSNDTALKWPFVLGFYRKFAQNIYWGYTLEPPYLPSTHKQCSKHRLYVWTATSTEHPQGMSRNIEYTFYSRKMHTRVYPSFHENRWRNKHSMHVPIANTLSKTGCFHDEAQTGCFPVYHSYFTNPLISWSYFTKGDFFSKHRLWVHARIA